MRVHAERGAGDEREHVAVGVDEMLGRLQRLELARAHHLVREQLARDLQVGAVADLAFFVPSFFNLPSTFF